MEYRFRWKVFARHMKEYRGESSYYEIQRLTGLDHTTIRRIEEGRAVTINTWLKTCSFLEISPVEFIGVKKERGVDW